MSVARPTLQNDTRSNGGNTGGIKKRFLLKPISPPSTPKFGDRDSSPAAESADGVTTAAASTPAAAESGVVSPRARMANLLKRAAAGSRSQTHSPQPSLHDATTAPTTPLANAIEPNTDSDDEPFKRPYRRRHWLLALPNRIRRLFCSGDGEFTLTSIQVDRASMM